MVIDAKRVRSELVEEVEELSGQKLSKCYLCGKCTAGCPMAASMDLLPHQVMRYLQLGMVDEVLKSKTIWICSSCLLCQSRCPREVDIPRIMEALRAIYLRRGVEYFHAGQIDRELLERAPQQVMVAGMRKLSYY